MNNRTMSIFIIYILVASSFFGFVIVTDNVSAAGPTYVSGSISADTTWNLINSPYIVTGDVTVDPGFTLTIEPGVEVRFNGTHSIIVDGTLIASGTPASKIIFTSNQSVPAKGDWYTIRLRTDNNLINHAQVEYATYGIFMTFFGTNNTISNTSVTNCKFDGIYITNSDYNTISNCTSTNNDRFGITIYESHGTHVSNTTIQYNNFFGINLNASTFTQIFNTNISYNDGKGLLLYSNSHNTTISGCEVDWNNHIGIDLWGSKDNDIINTTTVGNNGIGIDFHSKTRNQWIENCTIMYNNNTGIDLRGSSYVDIVRCNVSRNKGHGGIYSGEPVMGINITYSKVLNNSVGHGIDLYEASWINITHSKVSGNVGNGIFCNLSVIHSYIKIKNCTVAENGLNGVYFLAVNSSSGGISRIDNNDIFSNRIYSNANHGIHLSSNDVYSYISYNNIHSNTVYSNKQNGILISSVGYRIYIQDNNIYSNTIYFNNEAGIYIFSENHVSHIVYNNIYSNTLFSNNGSGVYIYTGSAYSYIIYNDIFSNGIYSNGYNGIYISASYNRIYIQNNNIYSNNINSNGNNGISIYSNAGSESYVENNNINSNNIHGQTGFSLGFGNAVDNNELPLRTYGNALWNVDTSIFYFDSDSLKTGNITIPNQYSILETTVIGPGRLSFYWKVSSHGADDLKFYVDGNFITDISGEVDWTQEIYDIGPGIHIITWRYQKSSVLIYGSNCGWLDKVEYSGPIGASGIIIAVNNPTGTWQKSNIYSNNITSYIQGIVLLNMQFQVINVNNISYNEIGVLLINSKYNSIRYNNITFNNVTGINLTSTSSSNIIENNNITATNITGISIFDNSNDNLIRRNNITYNQRIGMNITDASGNQVHHNNFINNTQNAYDSTIALNDWDDGVEGNYWSDYLGSDDNGDGFGEDPYVIPDGGSRDWHPFIEMVDITAPYIELTVPANGEINVPLDTTVSITFSKTMNTTAVESAISMSGGLTPTAFVWAPGFETITFTPSSNLISGTKYTVTITTDAKDTQGNRIKITYVFSFTAEDIWAPEITWTSPSDGELDVDLNSDIDVMFTEPMQPGSVTFTCTPDPQGWSIIWNVDYTALTFSHNIFGNKATYTFHISAAKDKAGLDLVPGLVPNPWSFTTKDIIGPEIISTSPADNLQNVSTSANVVVSFNEEMNIASVTFTCSPDPLGWTVVWTNNNQTATFSHNNFTERTLYTFQITGGQDIPGNPLNPGAVPNPWSFTTTGDYLSPEIAMTLPADMESNVALNRNITVTFNEPMDTSSVILVCIPNPGGWSEIWSSGDTVVTYSHNPFENGTSYNCNINMARDVAGNGLVSGAIANPWYFVTVGDITGPQITSTSPFNNEVNVDPDADIVVVFSEAIDPSSVTYTCTPDSGGWSVIWSNGNTVATFSHNTLTIGTFYTFQITTAEDVSGNDLVSGPVPNPFSFTAIGDVVAPEIISTTPADNDVGVAQDTDIVVTFSEAMYTPSLNYFCTPDPGGWSEVWSNGNTVVTFSHNQFAIATMYTFHIIVARDVAMNDLNPGAVPNPWSFTTSGELVAPQIIVTNPPDQASDVLVDADVVVTFSEAMDTSSLDFICIPDPGGWSESWSSGDTILTLSHSPFEFGTIYNFYIISGTDVLGNAISAGATPNPWSFTTVSLEFDAPRIISTSPDDDEANVDPGANIVVTFSKAMNTSTFNYLCTPDPGGWTEVWSNGDTVVTLTHDPFDYGTLHNFYVIAGADMADNELIPGASPNPWSFTTIEDLLAPEITLTSPADDETEISLNRHVTVVFSEPMDTSSIYYTCTPDPEGWMESWSSGDTILTLSHDSFELGTAYTFELTAAKDVAGNNLTAGAIPSTFDFSTISMDSLVVTPPEVTIPVNGTVVLIAQAYDSQNNPISDISYVWSVDNILGTVYSQDQEVAIFKASSSPGTCTVSVSVGGETDSTEITITSEPPVEEEPVDDPPEDVEWISFMWLLIITACIVILVVIMWKKGPEKDEDMERVEEDKQSEELAEDDLELGEESELESEPESSLDENIDESEELAEEPKESVPEELDDSPLESQ